MNIQDSQSPKVLQLIHNIRISSSIPIQLPLINILPYSWISSNLTLFSSNLNFFQLYQFILIILSYGLGHASNLSHNRKILHQTYWTTEFLWAYYSHCVLCSLVCNRLPVFKGVDTLRRCDEAEIEIQPTKDLSNTYLITWSFNTPIAS